MTGRSGRSGGEVRAEAMAEADLLRAVRGLARALGVRTYHTHRSDRSEPGFPDLVLLGSSGVCFRELKTATGRLRPAQAEWLTGLQSVGADAGLWRPADWLEGRVEQQLRRLR